jgi:hypothetical protein
MSRYMWRKYNQNLKKRSRLDSPEHGESRKVLLTQQETAVILELAEASAVQPAVNVHT